METVIAHGDADGVICLSIFLKKFGSLKCSIYFSSAFRLKDVICSSMIGKNSLDKLYVFDIAASEKTLLLSSVYNKAVWIDHHLWPELKLPENVEVFLDTESPSAAQLVGKCFGIDSELIDLANEIDRNETKSERAIFLRDLIAAIKWRFAGSLNNKLRALARDLAFSGLEKFEENEKVAGLMEEYHAWIKKIEGEILNKTKVFEVNGKKIAVYETLNHIPIYVVNNRLLKHEKAPFDIVAVLIHTFNFGAKKIGTKVELRSHTGKDIYKIASSLGGGGHRLASGATLPRFFNAENLVEMVKKLETSI